jgi:hypothetical protein
VENLNCFPDHGRGATIACIAGRPNNPHGPALPDVVFVSLLILGFDPALWGGLSEFRGEVTQQWYEDGEVWWGVKFGGSIGWCQVRPGDYQTFDWRQPPAPAIPQPPTLSVEEGSVGCLQN